MDGEKETEKGKGEIERRKEIRGKMNGERKIKRGNKKEKGKGEIVRRKKIRGKMNGEKKEKKKR